MSVVAIIGAGDLGGALAHKLALRDRIDEVHLIDTAAAMATGKALDIQQAAPIAGFRTRVTAGSELWAAAGADVIALADAAAPPGEWQGESGLALLRRLTELAPHAAYVCAGASQRGLIERGTQELRIPRTRLVGSAPGALASAIRALTALEIGGSPADVSLVVVGVPPDRAVAAWNEATVRGTPIGQILRPAQVARLNGHLARLWPPGPYALASAAARVCEAMATGGARRSLSCFVALDEELRGARGRVAAMPVLLGARRVEVVLPPSLSVQEQVQLENAVAW